MHKDLDKINERLSLLEQADQTLHTRIDDLGNVGSLHIKVNDLGYRYSLLNRRITSQERANKYNAFISAAYCAFSFSLVAYLLYKYWAG